MSQSQKPPSNAGRVPTVQLSTESVIAAYINELAGGETDGETPPQGGAEAAD